MTECNKVSINLLDSQLHKLKSDVKNQARVTLRMHMKIFDGDLLPHELLLTARQKIRLKNAFNYNISAKCEFGFRDILSPENNARKSSNNIKHFELYQIFMRRFPF